MKKRFLQITLSLTLIAATALAPATEVLAAGPTSGITSILGQQLTKNVRASVTSTGLSLSTAGIEPETEKTESGTEPETEFTEILSQVTESGEPEVSNEDTRAGVIGDLTALISAEVTPEEEVAGETEETDAESEEETVEEEESFEPICGYTNIGIAKVEGNLNIRTAPDENAELAGKLPENAACEILATAGDWYQITSGEVEGYVKGEYLLTGADARAAAEELKTLTATVTADVLNVREEANTESEIVDQMANGEEIPVLEELGEWLKVDVDGEERFINAEFVSVEEKLKRALTLTEARFGEGVSDVGVAVVNFATQYVGNPYVWGGTSLTNGADCSGFVLSVMANYGVYLPHSSAAQANCGTRVGLDELQPGDLIFYGSGKRIGHVAIYIGGGQICHASNKRTGITISNMYYRSPICATRVL